MLHKRESALTRDGETRDPAQRSQPTQPARPWRRSPTSAGVSRATVSRVVNGSPRVSPDVRVDVQAAIERLGYVPNRAARSLVTRRSDSIAVVITEPTGRLFSDPFFPRLLRGISSELAARDRQLILLMPDSAADETPDGRLPDRRPRRRRAAGQPPRRRSAPGPARRRRHPDRPRRPAAEGRRRRATSTSTTARARQSAVGAPHRRRPPGRRDDRRAAGHGRRASTASTATATRWPRPGSRPTRRSRRPATSPRTAARPR